MRFDLSRGMNIVLVLIILCALVPIVWGTEIIIWSFRKDTSIDVNAYCGGTGVASDACCSEWEQEDSDDFGPDYCADLVISHTCEGVEATFTNDYDDVGDATCTLDDFGVSHTPYCLTQGFYYFTSYTDDAGGRYAGGYPDGDHCDTIPCEAFEVNWDTVEGACNCYMNHERGTAGVDYYGLGGDVAAASCCGDDGGENMLAEISFPGGDAPPTYNEGGAACCDNTRDCVYYLAGSDSECYSIGGVHPAGAPVAYCAQSGDVGVWVGADNRSTACTALVGAGRWVNAWNADRTGMPAHAPCCGDDGEADDWSDGGGNVCIDGVLSGEGNADTNSQVCTELGHLYIGNDDLFEADNPNCCGNQPEEVNRTRHYGPDTGREAEALDILACCDNARDCVNDSYGCITEGAVTTENVVGGDSYYCRWVNDISAYSELVGADVSEAACQAIFGEDRAPPTVPRQNGLDGIVGVDPPCCGDDSNEYYKTITCYETADGSACTVPVVWGTVSACCMDPNACVYYDPTQPVLPGTPLCYPSNTPMAVEGILDVNDDFEICDGGEWHDADESQTNCGVITGNVNNWLNLNPAACQKGDCDDADIDDNPNTFCCGDDRPDEHRTSRLGEADADLPSPSEDYLTSPADFACCNSPDERCVKGNVCYDWGMVFGPYLDEAYCDSDGSWVGGDDSEAACLAITADRVIGQGRWSQNASSGEGLCCGDDVDPINPLEMEEDTFCSDSWGNSSWACINGSEHSDLVEIGYVCNCTVGLNNWDLDGEGTGISGCCGNTANEFNISRVCRTNFNDCVDYADDDCAANCISTDSGPDYLCCDNKDDCVADGNCYDTSSYTYGASGEFHPESFYVTVDAGNTHNHTCVNGSWVDPDQQQDFCEGFLGDEVNPSGQRAIIGVMDGITKYWVASGENGTTLHPETGFGEYNESRGVEECCGDDEGEYYRYFENLSGVDYDEDLCCDQPTDCVYEDKCYHSGGIHIVWGEEQHLCLNGEWGDNLNPKYTPDNEYCGHCNYNSECCDLVGVDPVCYSNTTFIGDDYCGNGEWTTRTKLIALQLLDIALENTPKNYTLFCDSYDKVLNYFDYNLGAYSIGDYFTGCVGGDCANNVCVLKLPPRKGRTEEGHVVFGTSLNKPIDDAGNPVFATALGISTLHCDDAMYGPGADDGNYHVCGGLGTSKVWYNNNTHSVIYTSNDILSLPVEMELDWFQSFTLFLKHPFESIFDYLENYLLSVAGDEGPIPIDYGFIQHTRDFSRLYLDRKNNRTIQGVAEKVYGNLEHISVAYTCYAADICDSVDKVKETIVDPVVGSPGVYCDYDTTNAVHYVAANYSTALKEKDFWSEITAKLRPEDLDMYPNAAMDLEISAEPIRGPRDLMVTFKANASSLCSSRFKYSIDLDSLHTSSTSILEGDKIIYPYGDTFVSDTKFTKNVWYRFRGHVAGSQGFRAVVKVEDPSGNAVTDYRTIIVESPTIFLNSNDTDGEVALDIVDIVKFNVTRGDHTVRDNVDDYEWVLIEDDQYIHDEIPIDGVIEGAYCKIRVDSVNDEVLLTSWNACGECIVLANHTVTHDYDPNYRLKKIEVKGELSLTDPLTDPRIITPGGAAVPFSVPVSSEWSILDVAGADEGQSGTYCELSTDVGVSTMLAAVDPNPAVPGDSGVCKVKAAQSSAGAGCSVESYWIKVQEDDNIIVVPVRNSVVVGGSLDFSVSPGSVGDYDWSVVEDGVDLGVGNVGDVCSVDSGGVLFARDVGQCQVKAKRKASPENSGISFPINVVGIVSLSCDVVDTGDCRSIDGADNKVVFRFKEGDPYHGTVQKPSIGTFNKEVCCNLAGDELLVDFNGEGGCTGCDVSVFNLQFPSGDISRVALDGRYPYPITMGAAAADIYCRIDTTCEMEETHLISVSGMSDAIVKDWDDFAPFPLKICCGVGAPQPGCKVQQGCTGMTKVLELSDSRDAHAGLPQSPDGPFTYDLCCPDDYGNDCTFSSAFNFLDLSGGYDAHAGYGVTSLFGNDVCLSYRDNDPLKSVSCLLESDYCDSGYDCILTLSSSDDAHVTSCTDYAYKDNRVCCKINSLD